MVSLDAAAVAAGSLSSDVVASRRKNPSPVVHSRTVTVRVFAVTSVMLTLSISDLTPGGGSHTSDGRTECTGDQCAGLQRFAADDDDSSASADVVASPARAVLPRTLPPDSFLAPSAVFLRAVPRSRFAARRPALTILFLILSRTTDDGDDVWREERVAVLECWRASAAEYVAAAVTSTDRDAAGPA